MSQTIHQEVDFTASPQRIYDTLTQAAAFGAMTGGAPAEIAAQDGGAFTGFGGMIVGRNIELVPDKRVVQAWRVKTWPEGVYSIAHFELTPHGTGTRLVFDHTGFPEGEDEHLAPGWRKMYWEPLRAYLG